MPQQKGSIKIPMWCGGCSAQGEIEVDNLEGNYFVICSKCGTETAQVWCDEGVGGQFIHNIHERPLEYECEICKKAHRLPRGFYKKPIQLKIKSRRKKKSSPVQISRAQKKLIERLMWLGYLLLFLTLFSGLPFRIGVNAYSVILYTIVGFMLVLSILNRYF